MAHQHFLLVILLLCSSTRTAGFCNVPCKSLKSAWNSGSPIAGDKSKKVPCQFSQRFVQTDLICVFLSAWMPSSIGAKTSFEKKERFAIYSGTNPNAATPEGRPGQPHDPSTPHGPTVTSAIMSSEPTFLTLKNGKIIPYPRGSEDEINAHEVCEYGERALENFLPETNHLNKLYNQAKLHYSWLRHQLLQNSCGKWVAVNSKGIYIVAANEKQVRQIAELAFPFGIDDYYADCVGCEILCGAWMDDASPGHDDDNPDHDDTEFVMPTELFSAVSPKKEFIVRAEHSFTGQDFKSYLMKHVSGANMMGVPGDVLSNPPAGVKLERGNDRYYFGPSGRRDSARVYKNNYIRVAGLTIKVLVIESRTWLLGYPVLSRFRNVLDVTAKEVVSLEPLKPLQQS